MKTKAISSRITSIIKEYYKQISFSDEYIDKLANAILESNYSGSLNQIIRESLMLAVKKFLKNHPEHSFIKKYVSIYRDINDSYGIKDSNVSWDVFITYVLKLNYHDNYRSNLPFYVEKEYRHYVIKMKEKEHQALSIMALKTLHYRVNKKINCSQEELDEILKRLKETSSKDYAILLKRHGKSWKEWNTLPSSQCTEYTNALKRLIKSIEKERKREMENNESLYSQVNKKIDCSQEELDKFLIILKEISLEYYTVLLNRHGSSWKEWNTLPSSQCVRYCHALQRLIRIIKKERKCKVDNQIALHYKVNEKIFCSQEELDEILEKLKETSSKDYTILLMRHGKSWEEWHPFTTSQCSDYGNALKKLIRYIVKEQKRKLKDKKNVNQEEINNCSENMKKFSQDGYTILLEKQGKTWENCQLIAAQEDERYSITLRELATVVQKEMECQKEKAFNNIYEFNKQLLIAYNRKNDIDLANDLVVSKLALTIIKARRKNMLTDEISLTFNIEKEDIYKIYATGITIFGKESINIITEILSNSHNGLSYLLNSESFRLLLEQLEAKDLLLLKKVTQGLMNQESLLERKKVN